MKIAADIAIVGTKATRRHGDNEFVVNSQPRYQEIEDTDEEGETAFEQDKRIGEGDDGASKYEGVCETKEDTHVDPQEETLIDEDLQRELEDEYEDDGDDDQGRQGS